MLADMNLWLQHLEQLPESARQALLVDFKHLTTENQSLVERLNDALQEIKYLRSLKFLPSTERGNGTEAELLQAEDIQADLANLEETLSKNINSLNNADSTDNIEGTDNTDHTDKPRAKPTGRRALPAHLPRVDIRHDVDQCACGACKADLTWIRDDITEKLHLIPAKVEVHRHIYPQYACQKCESIARTPAVNELIAGGLPSNGTLAWLAVSKYADHLPLYRIVKIIERDGISLPLSTLSAWIGVLGVHLTPLWQRLGEHIKQQQILHVDETPVTQLSNVKDQTKKAYIWAYRTVSSAPATIIWFDYHSSRSGACVRQFLGDWQGTIMVDDYAGYKKLIQTNNLIELGCWAHVRRKFFELVQSHQSQKGQQMLDLIAKLYKIEAESKELTPDQRHAIRQRDAIPILDAIEGFLADTQPVARPNSGLSRAVDYTVRRWASLRRYVEHGAYPIDNNPVENAIRPIAVGKKNWLFAGSERAGERAAVLQTLLATAKANDLNPYEWLLEVLNKLPTHPHARLDELLPLRRDSS